MRPLYFTGSYTPRFYREQREVEVKEELSMVEKITLHMMELLICNGKNPRVVVGGNWKVVNIVRVTNYPTGAEALNHRYLYQRQISEGDLPFFQRMRVSRNNILNIF